MLSPLPELLSAALSRFANPPLAVLTYSESERPFDIGLLIFSSVAFIGFAIRAYRGSRKEVRTKQTKAPASVKLFGGEQGPEVLQCSASTSLTRRRSGSPPMIFLSSP